MREESQYSKAKENSMVWAFSISMVIKVLLPYIPGIKQDNLIFEVVSTIVLVIVSWKLIYEGILLFRVWSWKKRNKFDISGKWYVLHYYKGDEIDEKLANEERLRLETHKDYIRIGTVNIRQKMDVIFLDQGLNYIPEKNINVDNIDLDSLSSEIGANGRFTQGSSWNSTNEYRFLVHSKELSGIFNVVNPIIQNDADGVHLLRVHDNQNIVGRYYNATSDSSKKPIVGEIRLYRDKARATIEFLAQFKKRSKT